MEEKMLAYLLERFFDLEESLKCVEMGVFPRLSQKKAVENLTSLIESLNSSLPYFSSSSFIIERSFKVLHVVFDTLEKIERSNVHYTPLGAVYLAEYLAEKIGGITLVVCFQSETPSHTCLSDIFKLAAPLLPENQKPKEEIVFITLPNFLKRDPLSYCLMARELALYLLNKRFPSKMPQNSLDLMADRLAALMMGPAYFFTLSALSTTEEQGRLQNIASLLINEGYRSVFDYTPQPEPPSMKLFHEIEELFRKTPAYYSPETFESEVPQLISRLLELLPPNEVILPDASSHPVQIPSILNAGWLVKQHHMPTFYKLLKARNTNEKHQARKRLNNLVEKAIELSVIHKNLTEAET